MGRLDMILRLAEKIDCILPLAHFLGCKAWHSFGLTWVVAGRLVSNKANIQGGCIKGVGSVGRANEKGGLSVSGRETAVRGAVVEQPVSAAA